PSRRTTHAPGSTGRASSSRSANGAANRARSSAGSAPEPPRTDVGAGPDCAHRASSATLHVGGHGLIPLLDPVPALLGACASALTGALFAAGDTAFTSLTSARLGALIDQSEGPKRAAYVRIKDGDAKLRSRYLLGRVLATAATAGFLDQAFQKYLPTYSFVV